MQHDTIIRVNIRPEWKQRVPTTIDDPEIERRMRVLIEHWLTAQDVWQTITVTAQWKGRTRTLSGTNEHRLVA